MSESDGRHPVRIVYHAENRTFARLFNEQSLEQLKNVIRQKLGLGQDTDVFLKQMIGSHAPLDLEDEADFQAFRVFLKSTASADVRVTVGTSRGSASTPREEPSTSKSTTAPSGGPVGKHVETTRMVEGPAKAPKTPSAVARKRRVSFDSGVTGLDKPAEQPTPTQPVVASTSAKTTEPPAPSKPVGAEEPPMKKRKKESAKAKDVQIVEAVESPASKTAAKHKVKKSSTSERRSKTAVKDAETPEAPVKKPKKQKKDGTTIPKKSSAVEDASVASNKTSLQLDKSVHSNTEGSTSNTDQSEKPLGVCASIPQTNASISVQSEVAAAILAGRIVPTEPLPKRKYVRKVTKKHSASSSTLPVEPIADTPANEMPDEHTPDLDSPLCPICLEAPFHIRYYCPTVLKGPDAIRERLEELQRIDRGGHQSLIKQLEDLLCDSKGGAFGYALFSKLDISSTSATSTALPVTAPSDDVQSRVSSPPSTSLPRTPIIPINSYLSEVTVESRDEGSSSESSDDASVGPQDLSATRRQKTPDEQPLPARDDLEAIISGPAPSWKNILDVIDNVAGDEDDSDSESDEDDAKLEEDSDEETGRSRHRPSRHVPSSSESEEESRSPSPSRSADGPLDGLRPEVQDTTPVGTFTEHQDGDVVMKDSVDLPVSEEREGDSSETHVSSEDHMVVDESIGGKDAAVAVREQPSPFVPRASVLPPSDAPITESQETGTTVLNQDVVPVASEVSKDVEADPIEPVNDLENLLASRLSDADPIETPPEPNLLTQSTPKSCVSKRIKTRNGHLLDDEADRPVLVERLAFDLAKGKSRGQLSETPASQEQVQTRRSPRFSSHPPPASTPAMVLLSHRTKSGKSVKTPAKQSQERLDASQSSTKDAAAPNRAGLAAAPSLNQWETMREPSSPAQEVDEPSMPVDELKSSSPPTPTVPVRGRPKGKEKNGRARKPATSSQAESSQGKERLFDLTSSQIPFPYSQHQTDPTPTVVANGNKSDGTSDSEGEPKAAKKYSKLPVRYRPLSQLASEATHFSPSLPTPANKLHSSGKGKKRPVDEDSSSSSSSSDADEANGSEHIPRGRRAGSALETRKKKKSLLLKI